MFERTYQNGQIVELLTPQRTGAFSKAKVFGTVPSVYDKNLKGYIFELDTSGSAKVQLPKDPKQGLGLLQPYLVLQIFLFSDKACTIEIVVIDEDKNRKRMVFTSNTKTLVTNPLHTRIPLGYVRRDTWLNLCVNVSELMGFCFKGSIFKTIESLSISSFCKLRRIFTSRSPIPENAETLEEKAEMLPKSVEFPAVFISNKINSKPDASLPMMIQPPSEPHKQSSTLLNRSKEMVESEAHSNVRKISTSKQFSNTNKFEENKMTFGKGEVNECVNSLKKAPTLSKGKISKSSSKKHESSTKKSLKDTGINLQEQEETSHTPKPSPYPSLHKGKIVSSKEDSIINSSKKQGKMPPSCLFNNKENVILKGSMEFSFKSQPVAEKQLNTLQSRDIDNAFEIEKNIPPEDPINLKEMKANVSHQISRSNSVEILLVFKYRNSGTQDNYTSFYNNSVVCSKTKPEKKGENEEVKEKTMQALNIEESEGHSNDDTKHSQFPFSERFAPNKEEEGGSKEIHLESKSTNTEMLSVIYDPLYNCYYDPCTDTYYQLKQTQDFKC